MAQIFNFPQGLDREGHDVQATVRGALERYVSPALAQSLAEEIAADYIEFKRRISSKQFEIQCPPEVVPAAQKMGDAIATWTQEVWLVQRIELELRRLRIP